MLKVFLLCVLFRHYAFSELIMFKHNRENLNYVECLAVETDEYYTLLWNKKVSDTEVVPLKLNNISAVMTLQESSVKINFNPQRYRLGFKLSQDEYDLQGNYNAGNTVFIFDGNTSWTSYTKQVNSSRDSQSINNTSLYWKLYSYKFYETFYSSPKFSLNISFNVACINIILYNCENCQVELDGKRQKVIEDEEENNFQKVQLKIEPSTSHNLTIKSEEKFYILSEAEHCFNYISKKLLQNRPISCNTIENHLEVDSKKQSPFTCYKSFGNGCKFNCKDFPDLQFCKKATEIYYANGKTRTNNFKLTFNVLQKMAKSLKVNVTLVDFKEAEEIYNNNVSVQIEYCLCLKKECKTECKTESLVFKSDYIEWNLEKLQGNSQYVLDSTIGQEKRLLDSSTQFLQTDCIDFSQENITVNTKVNYAKDLGDRITFYAMGDTYCKNNVYETKYLHHGKNVKALDYCKEYSIEFYRNKKKIFTKEFTTDAQISKITNVDVLDRSSNKLKLFIRPPSKCDLFSTTYRFSGQVKKTRCHEKFQNYLIFDCKPVNENCILTNLTSYSDYQFNITPFIGDDKGTSFAFNISTEANLEIDTRLELPKHVLVNQTHIKISQTSCEIMSGPLKYRLCYKKFNEQIFKNCYPYDYDYKIYNVTISHHNSLEGYSNYTLRASMTRGDFTEIFKFANFTTAPKAPGKVRDLTLHCGTPNRLWLKWLNPDPPQGEPNKYKITIKGSTISGDIPSSNKCKNSKFFCAEIKGNLGGNLMVDVKVSNKNVKKFGDKATVVIDLLPKPNALSNLKLQYLNSSSLNISWEDSSNDCPMESCIISTTNLLNSQVQSYLCNHLFNWNIISYNTSTSYNLTIKKPFHEMSVLLHTLPAKPKVQLDTFPCNKTGFCQISESFAQQNLQGKHNNLTIFSCDKTYQFDGNTTECLNNNSNCIQLNNHINESLTRIIVQNEYKGNCSLLETTYRKKYFNEESANISLIVLILSIIVVIFLLLTMFWWFKLFKHCKSKKDTTFSQELFPIYENVSISLEKTLRNRLYDMHEVEKQYLNLKDNEQYSCNIGSLPENLKKNRYINIIAYDHSRVVLNGPQDYINANYVDGYEMEKKYIAAQGPKKNTVVDFWTMIWQENVRFVVMVTKLKEKEQSKCEKYWPEEHCVVKYKQFSIKNVGTTVDTYYTKRKLLVQQDGKNKEILQLHFTSWPDHGAPSYIRVFIPFVQEISVIPDEEKPILVHCSAGVGRTGTVILCDFAIKMIQSENHVDFEGILQKLRTFRCNLVDNEKQYIFVHKVIYEFLYGKDYSIPVDNNSFKMSIKKCFSEDYSTKILQYIETVQWQDFLGNENYKVHKLTIDESAKVRFSDISINELCQLHLEPVSKKNLGTFINAIQVKLFNCCNNFIVTQQPLPGTRLDFWRMMDSYNTRTIVNLNTINKNNRSSCVFWPNPKKILNLEGLLKVSLGTTNLVQNKYATKEIHLTNLSSNSTKTINLISICDWPPERKTPKDLETLLKVIETLSASSKSEGESIVITCYDATTASGLFISLAFLIEQLNMEHVCDVVLPIREIRKCRKEFMQDKEQLSFLFRSALQYVESFETYSNFT